MPAELRLLLAPRETYTALARRGREVGALGALRRPCLAAIVIGASIAVGATRHVTPALLVSVTACWLFVVMLQLAVGVAVIAGPARRTVGLPRAIDLFFASHVPWSLWLLLAAAWAPSPLGRPLMPLLCSAAVPVLLTVRMVAAFFGGVLELDPREARLRTAIQQLATWGIPLLLYATAVGWLPRLLEQLR